jgi:mannan endo-1,6-alpha-mannosidase
MGDVNAGSRSTSTTRLSPTAVTTADKIGAGILTALVLVGVMSGSVAMVMA